MRRWWSAVPLVVLLGCFGKSRYEPGTSLGTFAVSGKLTSLTCGGTAPNPWMFTVKMSHEDRTLYWVQGDAPIAATVDGDGRAAFTAQSVSEVRAATPKAAGCSLARTDTLSLYLLDTDAKPTTDPAAMATFQGTLAYSYAPTEGSDCGELLAAAGGSWQALPCAAAYDVTGTIARDE